MPLPQDMSPHILVVEDDDDARALLCAFLQRSGFATTSVNSAERGLEALKGGHFAAVVTDYHLPAQTGTWMVSRAREAGVLHDEQVLVVTAAEHIEGADGLRVLHKPLAFDGLLEELRSACAA